MELPDDYPPEEFENNKNTLHLTIYEQISLLADIILDQVINKIIKTEQERDYGLGLDIS